MKAEKIITTTKSIDIEIKGITLLSIEEYEECKDIVPLLNDWWWLRSPVDGGDSAASVSDEGDVDIYGSYVDYDFHAVRPVLIYISPNLQIGDKIKIVDYNWTVISDNLMLCDDAIGHTYFREDWEADDANDYEKSDIKKWLENWWKERAEK